MATGSRLDFRLIAQHLTPEPDEYIDVLFPTATTVQLADADDRINTKDKFIGRLAWDLTLGEPVFATGAAAADSWLPVSVLTVPIASTTAELVDEADAINTAYKYPGKMVWDATKGQPVWADGPGVNDTWSLATGVVATTPAP